MIIIHNTQRKMNRNLFAIKHTRHTYDTFSVCYYFGHYDADTDTFTFEPLMETLPELAAVETNNMTQAYADAITNVCAKYDLDYVLDHCWLWTLEEWMSSDVPGFVQKYSYDF